MVFWEIVFGSFMVSGPNLGCSHWLVFVCTRMYTTMSQQANVRQHRNVIFLYISVFGPH